MKTFGFIETGNELILKYGFRTQVSAWFVMKAYIFFYF